MTALFRKLVKAHVVNVVLYGVQSMGMVRLMLISKVYEPWLPLDITC